MAKFKIGDRVRVVRVFGSRGVWLDSSVGKTGIIQEECRVPTVWFEDGTTDWGNEKYLELIEPKESTITIPLPAEITHITIGGKRFRLVPED